MVFGPIKILFDCAMALRTSSSQTKSVTGGSACGAGVESGGAIPFDEGNAERNRSTAETISARPIFVGSSSPGILEDIAASTEYASRLMLIKCRGPILSLVELPATAPQPSVMAGNRFVEIPVEPVGVGEFA